MARDERRRPVVDAGRRIEEYSSGARTALRIPEGLQLFQPKKPQAYKIEVVPYPVTDSIKKFYHKITFAKPSDWYYERTYFIHDNVGVNNEKVVCPAATFDKPCPICQHRSRLFNSPDRESAEQAAALKPKERQIWLVLDHAEPQKGIQLWELSAYCFGKQLDSKIRSAEDEDRPRYRRFADPDEGLTLRIIGEEKPMGGERGGKFMWFSVDEFRERRTPIEPEIFDHKYNLDDMVIEVSYDNLKKMFLQSGDADEEGGKTVGKSKKEDDDKPAGGFAKPGGKKKPDPDDDDDAPPAKKPAAEPEKGKVAKGDTVTFIYRDKRWTGKATGFNVETGIVRVECEGRENPFSVDVDDITVVSPTRAKAKPKDEDDEPAPKPKKKPAADDDDDDAEFDKRAAAKKKPADEDDEPPARKPKPKEDDEDKPAAKRKPAVDDDDDPPPRSKKPAAEDKPAKKPAAKKPDDDDWDD